MNDNLYELTLTDAEDGVFAMSLVDAPAIEVDWVKFSKEKEKYHFDSDKQILTGPALIPDFKIYRRDGDYEYFVYITKETIEQVVQRYAKQSHNLNVTLDHQIDVPKGVAYVFESWITSESDKSKEMGFDLPHGTWMISMKIEDTELWQLAKEGKVKGFSIEGLFSHEQVKNKKQNNAMSIFMTKLKCLLEEFSVEEFEDKEKDEELKDKDKDKDKEEEMNVTTALLDGTPVYISEEGFLLSVDEQGNPGQPMEPGEYVLADESVIVVGEDGQILSDNPAEESTEEPAEDPVEEPTEEEPVDEPVDEPVEEPSEESTVYTLEDGTMVEVSAEGQATIDGEPAPDGEHMLQDGGMIMIADGMLIDVVSMAAVEVINSVKEQLSTAKSKVKELKKELSELQSKYDELAASPASGKLGKEVDQADVPQWKQVADNIRAMKNGRK